MSRMWNTELADELRARGWTIVPVPEDSQYSPWYAYRVPPGPDVAKCGSNDSLPRLVLSKWTIPGTNSATMSLRAANCGVWYEVSAFSLDLETLPARLDEVSSKLAAGWTSLASAHSSLSAAPAELSKQARDALVWLSCPAQASLTCLDARMKVAEYFGESTARELGAFLRS